MAESCRESGVIEHEFLAAPSVVGNYMALPLHAYQELVQPAMGVLAANFLGGHARNQEIALHLERNLVALFRISQQAAQVLRLRQAMESHAGDSGLRGAALSGNGRRGLGGRLAGSLVTDNARWPTVMPGIKVALAPMEAPFLTIVRAGWLG